MVIRPLSAADIDGLTSLYEGLDAEARHRRFFSAFSPSREFLARMTDGDEGRGFGLAAVVQHHDTEVLVAEASCSRLPNGDAELALTVAQSWRGWLGPYLLDALVEAAAARGIPNLEADVLVSNTAMLAMLHARGAAVMDHTDWTVVRLIIGTRTSRPNWPGAHDGVRVLVEVPGGRWHAESEARQAGLQLLSCRGPGSAAVCPALTGQPCPLAAQADIIVVAGPPGDERWRALTGAHSCIHPGVPVWVELRDRAGEDAARASTGDRLASRHRDAVERVIAARLRYERTSRADRSVPDAQLGTFAPIGEATPAGE